MPRPPESPSSRPSLPTANNPAARTPVAHTAVAYTQERRRQLRGLLLLALAVLLFSLVRAGGLSLFHPGWWRLW